MLSAFGRAFRTPDLRKKILFTLAIMAPVPARLDRAAPGVSTTRTSTRCIDQVSTNSSALRAGQPVQRRRAAAAVAFSRSASCRTSPRSIIIQLLIVVIPRLEQLKKQGQAGQAKLTQYTRYLTIALAILQSTGFVALARRPAGCSPAATAVDHLPDDIGSPDRRWSSR